jgi:hypothetical protein
MNLQNRIEEIKANGSIRFFQRFQSCVRKLQKNSSLRRFLDISILLCHIRNNGYNYNFNFGIATLTTMLTRKFKTENVSENFNFTRLGNFIVLFDALPAALIKMVAERDEEFHVSSILEYYKVVYFKELFIATLLISAFSLYSNGLRLFGNPINH